MVWFNVLHTDTNDATLDYQLKFEDEGWTDTYTARLPYEGEHYTMVPHEFAEQRRVRKFQMRIMSMDTNIRLREIRLGSESFNAGSYST